MELGVKYYQDKNMEIKNKRIVVTGAASGIGLALCEEFHASGAQSIVCFDMNEDGAKEIAEKINGILQHCALQYQPLVQEVVEDKVLQKYYLHPIKFDAFLELNFILQE